MGWRVRSLFKTHKVCVQLTNTNLKNVGLKCNLSNYLGKINKWKEKTGKDITKKIKRNGFNI